jgi:hypothetical protein
MGPVKRATKRRPRNRETQEYILKDLQILQSEKILQIFRNSGEIYSPKYIFCSPQGTVRLCVRPLLDLAQKPLRLSLANSRDSAETKDRTRIKNYSFTIPKSLTHETP